MNALLPIAEAQARLLARVQPVSPETLPLAAALHRYAAADAHALRTQPDADLSAMDGYAIRFADLPGPFTRIGESAAGRPFGTPLGPRQTARIFTGAALPDGADSVLVQEEATPDGVTIRLTGEGPLRPGGNVRRRGLDFAAGDPLIRRGDRLTPARLAVAAIAGLTQLSVARAVRVAIAATGDELGTLGTLDALPESNRLMLAAQLAGWPVEIVDMGILSDDLTAMRDAFAAVRADLIVTTGGASVGDHDLVRPALEAAGGTIDFWRIALRPGKPMLAGRLGDAHFLGLPGNPVSAFVTAELFVKPLIAALAGAADPLPRTLGARLGEPLPANGPRTDYLRAQLTDGRVSVAAIQDSSMLLTLARANCLVVRPPHAPPAAVDEIVDILPLA
ncbi:MAG: molybdopterin molybdotransferase MoeA [Pseudomonadota bacterium]